MSPYRRARGGVVTWMVVAALCIGACGADESVGGQPDASMTVCSPGDIAQCACAYGYQAAQRCNATGTGWLPCKCPSWDATPDAPASEASAGSAGAGGDTADASEPDSSGGSGGAGGAAAGDAGTPEAEAEAGPTEPEVLVASGRVAALAVGGGQVFWADSRTSRIQRTTTDPPGAPALVAESQATVRRLFVAMDSLVWATEPVFWGGIRTAPISGGPVTLLVEWYRSPRGGVPFGGEVFWGDLDGIVSSVPLMPGDAGAADGAASVRTLADLGAEVIDLVASGGTLFIATRGSTLDTIWSVASTGGPAVAVATVTDVDRLAADDQYVFWTSAFVGHLGRLTRASGVTDLVVSDPFSPGPSRVEIDSGFVYWSTTGTTTSGQDNPDGELWRMPLAGGPHELVAEGQRHPRAIAFDSTYVYWGTNDDGIRRLPK